MTSAAVETNAPIPTWFGVGGGADALARPGSIEELRGLLGEHAGKPVRTLGDGANLLVDDPGVDGLVVSLERLRAVERVPAPTDAEIVILRVGAGANLPRLITDTVREGFAGLETLAGVPASVGGAVMMNAGGSFGRIADCVHRVRTLDLQGRERRVDRADIAFGYRCSGLEGLLVVEVEFALRRTEGQAAAALRERMKEIMALKKASQPMAERSAGCFWKNPLAPAGWSGPRTPDGLRIGAGWLVDHAGLKGMRVGGARVSEVHANFVVTDHDPGGAPRCSAGDVLALMREVRRRTLDRWGIALDPEVVVWRRAEWDPARGGRATL